MKKTSSNNNGITIDLSDLSKYYINNGEIIPYEKTSKRKKPKRSPRNNRK